MSERTERRRRKKRSSTVYPLNKIIDSITYLNRYKQVIIIVITTVVMIQTVGNLCKTGKEVETVANMYLTYPRLS